jgi:hypothetical protein
MHGLLTWDSAYVCYKECRRAHADWAKQHYSEGGSGRSRLLTWRDKKRRLLDEPREAPCADCGVSYDKCVMDFDHREGEVKLFNLGGQVNRALDLLVAEIAKCDVVCANCHRLRTKNRGYKTPRSLHK